MAKIKHLLLPCLGFVIQYIVPIILFGNVIPYTRGTIEAGLTVMGYIAMGIIAFILIGKIKAYLLSKPKSLTRGIILSIFPVVAWLIVNIGISAVVNFLNSFLDYWHYTIIFIIIGRLFYILDEALTDKELKEQNNG